MICFAFVQFKIPIIILSSEISSEIESLKMCKESMEFSLIRAALSLNSVNSENLRDDRGMNGVQ